MTASLPIVRPESEPLIDQFGRVATDLRVSVTDRCNLRCQYCMPEEGLDWTPDERLLTDDEMIRLISIAVQHLGVRDVRFTGGEPLLRKGLEHIISSTHALTSSDGAGVRTSLTTNGVSLARRASALAEAGLDRVNVSLDTLQPERYHQLARRDRWHDVVAGLAAADAAGLRPVKVNAVLMRGINDDEAAALLSWALEMGYEMRFIEQMPLGPVGTWHREDFITVAEIHALLGREFNLEALAESARGSAPAEVFTVHGGPKPGTVGLIASVSQPFCGACNRVRLTADGQVRNCLFAQSESDLLGPLRSGADDETLASLWREAMWGKKPGHGIDDPGFLQPQRPMAAIGG